MKKTVVGVVLRPNQLAFAVASAFLSAGVAAQTAPGALPSGGQVTSGSAMLTYSPNKLQIDQGTDKAILQWNSFSIGSSAWVNFSQPSASAVALNRVTGTNPSEIFGRLTSNGQVFLSNPNGVLFAPGASVDVGGLFATTLSIADRDFLAGRYNFYNAGGAGSVVNQGVITATGYAALAAPQVKNDGLIVARAGTVALAAGDRVSLDMVGDGLIKVSVDQAALNASAINSGRIEADGGNVVLTARSANALLDTVINNTGIIRANSLIERNGEIVLDGGSAGLVANSGTLQAAGVTAGTSGGTIKIVGDRVAVTGNSVVDTSGDVGGGSVVVGSAASSTTFIGSDAIVRADATREGSGGFVETSGRFLEVNSAPQIGAGGTWAIDPFNIEIVPGNGSSSNNGPTTFTPNGDNSQIGATLINNQLNAGTNVTIDTGGAGSAGGQAGDLKVNGEISKTVVNASTLTLSAFNELQINRNIGMANGALTFNAGRITNTAAVSTTGGNTLLNSDAFNLAGGTINGGTGAVILRPRTGSNSFGIEAGGTTTVTNADIASISTSDFVVFGSGSVFTGNMTIGANAAVQGGTKNLAFFRAPVAGSTTVGSSGVSTTGNVIVSAGGGSLNGVGLITGNQVQLRASTGIGSAAARVNVATNVLAVNNTGGTGAFVNASGPVTVNNVNLTVGGNVNNVANVIGGGGAYDLIAGGVTVAAPVNAGTINVNAAGDLQIVAALGRLASLTSTAGQTLTANSVQLLSNGGSATISNTTGNTVINADAFSLAGGSVNGGNGAVVLRPRTGTNSFGIESAGQTTVSNNDIAAITTSDFVVFGSGLGTTFTGNMTIGANVTVQGGTKNLAFFRASVPGSTTVGSSGVTTTGNVIVSAGGGALNSSGGTVTGNQVQLRASTGIGSAAARVNTAANVLAINNTGGAGAFVNATGPVTLDNVNLTVGGNVNNVSNTVGGGGAYDLTAGSAVTVTGPASGGTVNINAGGPLKIQGNGTTAASLASTSGQTLNASSIELSANGAGATINNTAGNTVLNADTFSLAGGAVSGGSGAVILRPRTGTNSFGIEAAGQTTVSNADIAAITTSDFVVFGSGLGTTFTGNMTIGANAHVDGGSKNLAFFRSTVPGGSTTVGPFGVGTSGNLIVSGGGGVLNGTGTIAGNQVQLRASTGIGSAAARVNAAGNVLAINTGGTGAFVNALGPVTLGNVNLTVGGNVNNISNFVGGGGAYDLTAGGSVNVVAPVSGGTINLNSAGDLRIVGAPGVGASLTSTSGQTLAANSVQLLSNGGNAAITNGTGNTVVNADAFSLAGGAVNGGSGAVVLRPRTGTNSFGIESAGQTTVSNADIAAITTSDFVVFGSGLGTTFTGNMTIGANATVQGGTKNLAFFRAALPGSTTIGAGGVSTTGNVIVSGGGGALNSAGGTVTANQVQLRASTGIGSAASRVNTSAQTLAVNNTGGTGAFVNATGAVTLDDVNLTVGGNVNNVSNIVAGGGAYDLTAGGSVNVAGPVSGGTINLSAAGDLRVLGAPGVGASLTSSTGQTLTANSVQLLSNGGSATINNSTGNTVLNSDAFSLAGGAVSGGSGAVVLRPRTGTNSFGIESAAQTTVSNADIAAITTSDFVVFGSGLGTTFTGNMTIGANAHVDGGSKDLAFFRSTAPGGATTVGPFGVGTTGNLIVSGGGGVLNGTGTIAGNQVQLRASTGIGSAAARVNTAANILAINTGNGGAFVNATGPVTLGDVNLTVGGNTNNVTNNATGVYDLKSTGAVTVTGQVAGGTMNVDAAGALKVVGTGAAAASLTANAGQTIKASSLDLTADGVNASILNLSGHQSIDVAGDITLQNSKTNVSNSFAGILGPTQTISAGGDITLTANYATGTSHGVRIGGLGGVPGSDTNLTLTSTNGSVVLNGGAGAANGAAIGSTVASTHPSVITINALNGQVTLNSGADAGARIGYASGLPAGGDITINAVGLQLNGAAQPVAIRTQDTVNLNLTGAASESSNSFIQAGALNLKAASASLTGPNKVDAFNANVGSDVTLVNSGALDVTGLSAGANATLDNTGDVTVSGPWTAGGTTSITVHSDLVVRDRITSHDVALSATSGSIREEAAGAISAATLTTSSVGDTTLGGANSVGTFAASSQTGAVALANTGSLTLGSIAAPGGLDLANTGSISFGGSIATAGTLALASDGDLDITQALQAGELKLASSAGSISSAVGVALTANTLRSNAAHDTTLLGANAVQALDAQTGGALRFNTTTSLNVLGVRAADANIKADGAITEAASGAIVTPVLTTSSGGATVLGGANQIGRFTASAGGDVLLTNASPVLSLGAMVVPGTLTVNQTGALSLKNSIFSLSQSYAATGDITVGDAAATAPTALLALGSMDLASGGSVVLRGSDTTPLGAAVVAGGTVNVSSARDLRLIAGDAALSPALILGGNRVDLRVGGALRLEGDHHGSSATVETVTTSGRINVYFPNASSGGYFVDGFQRLKHGQDGFFVGNKPAKEGKTLFLNYGQ